MTNLRTLLELAQIGEDMSFWSGRTQESPSLFARPLR